MNHPNSFYVIDAAAECAVSPEFSGYVIFYRKDKDAQVAAGQLELFRRLVENGLKLSMNNFLLVDTGTGRTRLSALQKTAAIHKCILFGVSEKEIGVNITIPLYHLVTVNGIDFIKSDAPEILEQNKALKNKLWEQFVLAFKLNK